ncbi:M23 family metallopeptidase [Flammeovirgaceae bacterium SG7u.111]|nr:M23 family metallopeptidase [Flammeovirgaceae bacterium SG7u.132]WPO33142.1 M23 family metallopeptidase [Flammeovirgaceae bacterium SG7u.111]
MIAVLVFSFVSSSEAQFFKRLKAKKNKKNIEQVIEPITYISDSGAYCLDELFTEKLEGLVADQAQIDFNLLANTPAPPPKKVWKDTCLDDSKVMIYRNKGEDSTFIDRKWLENADYYAIWDSWNLNPYGTKIGDFNDSVPLKLYDENNWSAPLHNTEVNSKFGMRRWRWHHGTDLGLNIGDSVFAAFDGVIRIAKYNYGGYGYYLMVRHDNGLETLYGHLKEYLVQVGDTVKAGQLIGWGGNTGRSTGPHLHFEVRYKGFAFNPTYLFDFDKDALVTSSDFVLTKDHYKKQIEQSKAQYHRIRSGDSLWVISRRYHTSISKICRLNGISRNSTLRIGRSLRVR